MNNAIEHVANELGYTHITPKSTFIFVKDESADITELVAEKLGYSIKKEVSE